LALEATLFGFAAPPINRARLGWTTANLAYTQVVTVHRQSLVFSLTTLQLHAIEAGRTGPTPVALSPSSNTPSGRVPGAAAPAHPGAEPALTAAPAVA